MRASAAPLMQDDDMDWHVDRRRSRSLGHISEIANEPTLEQRGMSCCHPEPRNLCHRNGESENTSVLRESVSPISSNSSLRKEEKQRLKHEKKIELEKQHEKARLEKQRRRRRKWSSDEAKTRAGRLLRNIANAWYSLFDDQTYIVVNQHGTTFRFSESKSLFLFERSSRVRQFCINLFIRPLFSHFIMLVILANCVCMMLAEPPKWIDSHLEYVFTAIYCFEAAIKIIGRGFVLHRFSYLRDPWNWLDFIVIVFAIITEVLKVAMYTSGGEANGELSQLSVLRAFRVLRALKTMSVVPGLRGIVKALLRSIRALQDAVALTIFCVSVFALVGYQLFHGTLRNKCVLIPGYIDDGPDAMYLVDFEFGASFSNQSFLHVDFDDPFMASNQTYHDSFLSSYSLTPLYNTPCTDLSSCKYGPEYDFIPKWRSGLNIGSSDTNFTERIFDKIGEQLDKISSLSSHSNAHNCIELLEECVTFVEFDTYNFDNSSLLFTSTPNSHQQEPGELQSFWGCEIPLEDERTPPEFFFTTAFYQSENTTHQSLPISRRCNVTVVARTANISCMYQKLEIERNAINSSNEIVNHGCYKNDSWVRMLYFGDRSVLRWKTRKAMTLFQLRPSGRSDKGNGSTHGSSFLIFEEYTRDDMKDLDREVEKAWDCNEENYIMRNIDAGMYFYVNSSNRPGQEPLYCRLGDKSVCPETHECVTAGGNPDFGYTNFDHFFWAFLTSFRLINQDAWSRLYYLTLHTIGESYVIFYIFVMFLGSYYLVNLILAVVYMAYEEQQAAAEDEALEEEEHKAERREIQPSSEDDRGSRSKDDGDNGSRSSVRSCCVAEEGRSLGLITTSLTSIADSGGMRRSNRSSRRYRYGHRRPPAKVDPESELLYRKYTRRYGDGMSHERIDNFSYEVDRDRYPGRGGMRRIRQDSVASTGSFRTVSERNSCSRCSSKDVPTSRVGYCPQCRSHRKHSMRKSKSNMHRRRHESMENEKPTSSVEPQFKLVVTPETPNCPEGNSAYPFLTPGQTPKPVGTLLKNSNLDVLAVDFSPGRSPSIYSTASEGNYEAENESDDTSKQHMGNEALLNFPRSKQIPECRPNINGCGLLAVPFDRASQSTVSISSNSEAIDGGEQVVRVDVSAPNALHPPSYSESEKYAQGSNSGSNHPSSSRGLDMAGLTVPTTQEAENGAATIRQVPSLMVTSASSEHIVSLCKKDLEKDESNNNGVGVYAKHSLPAIAGSPNLNSTDHNLNELHARQSDNHDRMSDSGVLSRVNRSMHNRHRHKQFHRGSSLDLVESNSYPPDRSLAASVISNLQQSRLLPIDVSPSHKFRFFDKEPESYEMLLINGHVDKAALSEIAANMLSADEDHTMARRGRSLKSIKRQLRAAKETAVDIFCKWTCCTPQWEKLQKTIRLCVLDPFMDLFITLCIFLNTFFMMMEYHPAEDSHKKLLEDANLVFTAIFTLEMFLKVIGLGPYTYFREAWNMFDAVVVISSLLEIILQKIPGLSVLRAFRLMRILKLAKSWPTLNKLLRIIGKTLGKLWHLTLVFLLVLFIFAVVGMQLLRENYKEEFETHMPRWNFVDFPHAFMVVFRIQCGEWIENMFVCMNVAPTGICITLFILVLVIGNLVILNLFLALLLNSFSGDALQRTDAERNSLAMAWHRILGGIRRGTHAITGCLRGCNVVADCCSKLQLQLCLKQRRVQSSDKKIGKREKITSSADPSKTEMTMLRDSDVELNNGEEQRNNNHVDVVPGYKLSSSHAKAHGISSKVIKNSVMGEEIADDRRIVNSNKKEADLHNLNCTMSFKCLGCDKQFTAPKAKLHTHRKRIRVREGFAPAAAFQNRPDETYEVIANQGGDDVTFHPRKRSQACDSIEFTRNSSEDRSKVASTESNTSGSVRQSNGRRLKTCSEKSNRPQSTPRKRASERASEKSCNTKHSEAGETDLLLTGNNVELDSAPSRRSSRTAGRRSRRRSNASTSTRHSSPSVRFHQSMSGSRSGSRGSRQGEEANEDGDNNKDVEIPQCFPPYWTHKVGGKWWKIRSFFYNIAVHRYFENVVIFCILLSSVALAFEDIHLQSNPSLAKVLEVLDKFFCTFFAIEMLIKWIGFGLRYYFTNAWCLLDFVIVFFSLLDLCLSLTGGASEQLGALRVLRTFRALRPLRALSRFQGMKVVVDALVRAIPSIFHVFLVCVIVWLIFSILGVNFFGGRFGRCVMFDGMTGVILPRRDNVTNPGSDINITVSCYPNATFPLPDSDLPAIRNREECETCAVLMNTTQIQWVVPSVNFDNVGQGFLALMQVATFKGWLEIMASAVDVTGEEEQPSYEYSFHNYFYFCIFIVFGAFFSLNLFIGVIIDNFNQQKVKCAGGEDGVFLTDEQKRYYNAMKRMAAKAPSKPIPRPNSWFPNKIYDVVTNRKFEMVVMAMILLNMVVMAIEHYDMSPELDKVLENLNLFFICVFFLEAVLKLIGLRWYYFTVGWNVFDIIVVVVSVIVKCLFTATSLSEMIEKYFVQPTLFRIIRLFRVTRILRLIREAKGIRTLLFALMMSLPALFNIGSLLFLVVFIYAILGMSQFAYVQKIAGLDDILNFETFPNTFLVLFQVSTSEGWNTFIEPILRDKEPLCDPTIETPAGNGNCGNAAVGVAYFVTFVLITFLIVINMYIAIILENFEVATRESSEPLTADDFEQFFEVWQRYDDKLTQYVTLEQLQHFLHHLDFPLQVPFPNRAFIVNARMKITKSGRVHCLEVILALIKKVLGDSPELDTFKDAMLQSFMLKCKTKQPVEEEEMIDTVEYERRRRAAIIIQKAYKSFKNPPPEESGSSDCESSSSSSEPT